MHKYRDSSSGVGFLLPLRSDGEIESNLKNENGKLIILYVTVPWCGACQKLNPAVNALAAKYKAAVFLQANAEKCPMAAQKYNIDRVPAIMFLHNRLVIDRAEGPSPYELEAKIRRNLTDLQNKGKMRPPSSTKEQPFDEIPRPIMSDVKPYMIKDQCLCINDLTPTPFNAFIGGKKLVSGKGTGRLLLMYAFKEKMLLTSFKVKAPANNGPSSVRFFVNLSKVLDFAVASQTSSALEIKLTEASLQGDQAIPLGGLVGVENLQLFIPENMTKNRTTEIESLTLIGAPMSSTGQQIEETPTEYATGYDAEGYKSLAMKKTQRKIAKSLANRTTSKETPGTSKKASKSKARTKDAR